jgi:hypothetical protein
MIKRQLILPGSALFAVAMFASSAPSYASAATQNPTAATIDRASQSSHHNLLLDCTAPVDDNARELGINDAQAGKPSRSNNYSGNTKACYEEGYAYGKKNRIAENPNDNNSNGDEFASNDDYGNGDDYYGG